MGTRSHLSPETPSWRVCGVHDIITGNKFHQNRLRDFRATGVRKSGTPLLWLIAVTTVQHYRADCGKELYIKISTSMEFSFKFLLSFGPSNARKIEAETIFAAFKNIYIASCK